METLKSALRRNLRIKQALQLANAAASELIRNMMQSKSQRKRLQGSIIAVCVVRFV